MTTALQIEAKALTAAYTLVGVTPYLFGGDTPAGADCSGLTLWAYAQAGDPGLPHASSLQYDNYPHVSIPVLGALVFFKGISGPPYPGHCGICSVEPIQGLGKMIEAQQTGTVVMESTFDMTDASQWWGASRPALAAVVPPPWPGRYFRYPPIMTGIDVREWQTQMDDHHGYRLTEDGAYGPLSAGACRNFQMHNPPLAVDGIVGKMTWTAVFA